MKIAFSFLLVSSLLSSACAWKSRRTEDLQPKEVAQTVEAPVVAAAPAEPAHTEPAHQEEAKAPAAVKPATPSAHHDAQKGVEPLKALGWLQNGNIRYRKGTLRKDGQSPKDVKRLSSGQTPHSIVLSCADSRVPPEIVFDQKLGEIFTVRNAGEIPDQASIASIEYALEHLGARLLLVMGHTSCGAVKAALGTMDGADAGSPALNNLVHDIHPRLASFKGQTPSANVEKETWANARGVAEDLMARSEIIRNRVHNGDLLIKTAIYHLDDGHVAFDAAHK
jgi:carbonic anhydrase